MDPVWDYTKMNKINRPESTIVDIARELSISPATASRALNDHPKISNKTKEKVRAKALELGYRRTNLASGRRNNKTYNIGMIVPRNSIFFHDEVMLRSEEHMSELLSLMRLS